MRGLIRSSFSWAYARSSLAARFTSSKSGPPTTILKGVELPRSPRPAGLATPALTPMRSLVMGLIFLIISAWV